MSAEEFVLIPKNMYVQQSPIVEQVLNNSQVSSIGKQLSALQRFQPPNVASDTDPFKEEIQPTKTLKENVLDSLVQLTNTQIKKCSHIYDALVLNPKISLDNNGQITIDSKPTGLRIGTFLFNLQQTSKVLDSTHKLILSELRLEEYLVANKSAKDISTKWFTFT